MEFLIHPSPFPNRFYIITLLDILMIKFQDLSVTVHLHLPLIIFKLKSWPRVYDGPSGVEHIKHAVRGR